MKYCLLIALLSGAIGVYSQAIGEKEALQPKEPVTDRNLMRIRELEDSLTYADPRKRFDLRFELFGRYLGTKPEKAMKHLEECTALANQSGDSLWIVKTLNAHATVLKNRGELKEAIVIYEGALAISKRNIFQDQIIYLLNNLALTYTELASFDRALKYHFESLKIRKAIEDAFAVSITLNNIGTVYHELGDLENALEFYEESYRVKVGNHVKHDLERCLVNIGRVLIDLGNFDDAEKRIVEALSICKRAQCRPDILLEAYAAFGRVLIHKQKFAESEYYLLESLRISKMLNLTNDCAYNYYSLANLKFIDNRFDEALNYLNLSNDLARRSGFQKIMLDNYLLYSQIFSARKDYAKAFEFQSLHNELNSKIVNGNLIRKISKVETEFAERENNAKIEAQSRIMELQEGSIEQQKSLTFALGWIAVLTVFLVIVLLKFYKRKQEINRILNDRVRERTLELEESTAFLKRAHDEQVLLMMRIVSDLKAVVATLGGFSSWVSSDRQELDTHFKLICGSVQKILDYVNRHALSV